MVLQYKESSVLLWPMDNWQVALFSVMASPIGCVSQHKEGVLLEYPEASTIYRKQMDRDILLSFQLILFGDLMLQC